jgi:methylglutaconyl-CoA hydratase
MTPYSSITVTIQDKIATVTIERAHARNALNAEAIRELTSAFTGLSTNSDIRCVLLRGSGTDAFCSGADLQELQKTSIPETRRDFFTAIATLIQAIQQCSHPTVSLVYGFALAGGLGLVAASDIVIAADDAQFGLPEVAVGLAPLVVAAPLSRVLSPRGLDYLALTGDRIGAPEALKLGLVTKVAPKESALSESLSLCRTIATRGPAAVQATKMALRDTRASNSNSAFIYELADRSALVSLGDEASEGIKAFTDKRSPTWKG